MAETEMVERVACQIALTIYGGYHVSRDEREKWPQWKICVECARAAIKAMRVPTDAMKNAAAFHDISFSYGGEDSFEYVSEDDAGSIFTTMIDAALSPPPRS